MTKPMAPDDVFDLAATLARAIVDAPLLEMSDIPGVMKPIGRVDLDERLDSNTDERKQYEHIIESFKHNNDPDIPDNVCGACRGIGSCWGDVGSGQPCPCCNGTGAR